MARSKKLTWDDWKRRFLVATRDLSEEQYLRVFDYEQTVTKSIESVVTYTGMSELTDIDEKKWSYAIELLIKFLPDFIEKNPSKKSVYYRTRELSFIRQRSWKEELIKQEECITRNSKSLVIQKGEDGSIVDIGFGPSDWDLGPNGLNLYRNDPETISIREKDRRILCEAVSELSSGKKKHTGVYKEIARRTLRGEKVGKANAGALGIPREEIAARAFEARELLKAMVADRCPATAEKQRIDKKQKSMKHKLHKLTVSDLKESYWEVGDIPPPVTIRDWQVFSSQRQGTENGLSRKARLVSQKRVVQKMQT